MKWCKVLIYLLFYMSSKKKIPFITVVMWFLILGKIQDGDHCWLRHRPPAAPPPIKNTLSCWEAQRLSTEGQIVSKYCNISKTLGRGSTNPPPHPPTLVGVWIWVYVQGVNCQLHTFVSSFRWPAPIRLQPSSCTISKILRVAIPNC